MARVGESVEVAERGEGRIILGGSGDNDVAGGEVAVGEVERLQSELDAGGLDRSEDAGD